MDKPPPKSGKKVYLVVVLAVAAGVVLMLAWLPRGERSADQGDLHVLCTFLPMYVFTLNVVGDVPGVDVDLLVDPNVGCPHSYSVRPSDLKQLARADIIVANGLGIEDFLDPAIKQNARGRLIVISGDCEVLDTRGGPGTRPYEDPGHAATQGTQAKRAEAGHAGHDHRGKNPHVWASPEQAIREVRSLARQLGEADPQRAKQYQAHAAAYVSRLEALARRMREAAVGFRNRKIVTFHDAFDYLARDLGLEVVASLTLEPDRPMSASQMAAVIQTIKRTGAAAVFCEPAYSDTAARTVGRDAGVPVFTLNPFNTLASKPGAGSYEEVMQHNLEVLQEALGVPPR